MLKPACLIHLSEDVDFKIEKKPATADFSKSHMLMELNAIELAEPIPDDFLMLAKDKV